MMGATQPKTLNERFFFVFFCDVPFVFVYTLTMGLLVALRFQQL